MSKLRRPILLSRQNPLQLPIALVCKKLVPAPDSFCSEQLITDSYQTASHWWPTGPGPGRVGNPGSRGTRQGLAPGWVGLRDGWSPKQGVAPGWAWPQASALIFSGALTSRDRCSKSAQQNSQMCQVEAWVKKPTVISDTRHPSEIP